MADNTNKPAAPAKKSSADLKKDYDALAVECTKLAGERPKVQRAVEAKVRAEMGDFDKKLQALKDKKRAAYIAYEAALLAEAK